MIFNSLFPKTHINPFGLLPQLNLCFHGSGETRKEVCRSYWLFQLSASPVSKCACWKQDRQDVSRDFKHICGKKTAVRSQPYRCAQPTVMFFRSISIIKMVLLILEQQLTLWQNVNFSLLFSQPPMSGASVAVWTDFVYLDLTDGGPAIIITLLKVLDFGLVCSFPGSAYPKTNQQTREHELQVTQIDRRPAVTKTRDECAKLITIYSWEYIQTTSALCHNCQCMSFLQFIKETHIPLWNRRLFQFWASPVPKHAYTASSSNKTFSGIPETLEKIQQLCAIPLIFFWLISVQRTALLIL